mmetsp:Transcript_11161/g.38780  ORF Transcript_11161/g.38780 Transcript_11161/m.38780 type:complete len:203 (+) Transcript_11161:1614-2222(+)
MMKASAPVMALSATSGSGMHPIIVAKVSPSERLMFKPGPALGIFLCHSRWGNVGSGTLSVSWPGISCAIMAWPLARIRSASSPSSLWSCVRSCATRPFLSLRLASTALESPTHATVSWPWCWSTTVAVDPLARMSTPAVAASSFSASGNTSRRAPGRSDGNSIESRSSLGTSSSSHPAATWPNLPCPSYIAIIVTRMDSSST